MLTQMLIEKLPSHPAEYMLIVFFGLMLGAILHMGSENYMEKVKFSRVVYYVLLGQLSMVDIITIGFAMLYSICADPETFMLGAVLWIALAKINVKLLRKTGDRSYYKQFVRSMLGLFLTPVIIAVVNLL